MRGSEDYNHHLTLIFKNFSKRNRISNNNLCSMSMQNVIVEIASVLPFKKKLLKFPSLFIIPFVQHSVTFTMLVNFPFSFSFFIICSVVPKENAVFAHRSPIKHRDALENYPWNWYSKRFSNTIRVSVTESTLTWKTIKICYLRHILQVYYF